MHKDKILAEIVKKKVKSKIISIEKFTKECLYGKFGYYNNSNVIGKKGDFITAPEISQLFGDIIGLFILYHWKTKIKKKFNFYELGPGKGTFLIDLLNITKKFNEFQKSMNIYLIEKNIKLIVVQKSNILSFNSKPKKINWLKNFSKKNQYPNIIFANEFFDCFPVRQFFKKNQTWYEKMIEIKYNEFSIRFKDVIINDKKTLKQLNQYKDFEVLEISNSRDNYFDKICKHIFKFGGMIIAIDYGYRNYPENLTLQSIYNNKKSNLLDNIGKQDISSLVDFNRLIDLGKKNNLEIEHFSSQREFLLNNGIKERENKILKVVNNKQRIMIQKGVKRILDKKDMGNLFKVLVLSKWN
ncbi:SAM-dependent methyltransferase [Alphaproteobacteria bacterium]|nr:SAM-dependent methyltransferase [Alphaproteobacteria bacterium]